MRPAGECALVIALALAAGCGSHVPLPESVTLAAGSTGVPYTWQEGDSWRFLAWAILDADSGQGYDALALMAGCRPDSAPSPGDRILLPLDPSLSQALQARMESARLVREATEARSGGSGQVADSLLRRAISKDPSWSVPAWDLALLQLDAGDRRGAAATLAPVAGKPRAEIMLARMSWEGGNADAALRHVETAMLAPEPSPEILACAAVLYTVTGNRYQASRLWLRILADPSAGSDLRILAVRNCLALGETR